MESYRIGWSMYHYSLIKRNKEYIHMM